MLLQADIVFRCNLATEGFSLLSKPLEKLPNGLLFINPSAVTLVFLFSTYHPS
jgi:hypothetical protein